MLEVNKELNEEDSGNRFTNNTKQNVTKIKVVTQQTVCTSARKLKETDISSNDVMEPDNDSNFNMIINCM